MAPWIVKFLWEKNFHSISPQKVVVSALKLTAIPAEWKIGTFHIVMFFNKRILNKGPQDSVTKKLVQSRHTLFNINNSLSNALNKELNSYIPFPSMEVMTIACYFSHPSDGLIDLLDCLNWSFLIFRGLKRVMFMNALCFFSLKRSSSLRFAESFKTQMFKNLLIL